jgi:hypothetical protein
MTWDHRAGRNDEKSARWRLHSHPRKCRRRDPR